MKPGVNALALLTVVLFAFCLPLNGCISAKQKFLSDMKAQGVQPLTGTEIKKLISGATLFNSGGIGEYRGYYLADGRIDVQQWRLRGEPIVQGSWEITKDGLFCEYFEGWTEEKHCYSVYPGKTKEDIIMVQMTGPLSENFPSGIVESRVRAGR